MAPVDTSRPGGAIVIERPEGPRGERFELFNELAYCEWEDDDPRWWEMQVVFFLMHSSIDPRRGDQPRFQASARAALELVHKMVGAFNVDGEEPEHYRDLLDCLDAVKAIKKNLAYLLEHDLETA